MNKADKFVWRMVEENYHTDYEIRKAVGDKFNGKKIPPEYITALKTYGCLGNIHISE